MAFKKTALSLLLLALSISTASTAYALDLAAVVGMDLGNISYNPDATSVYSSKIGFGVGALLGFDLNPMFEIETGLLYLPRKYGATDVVGVDKTWTEKHLFIPAVLRFKLPIVSLGGGVYYSKALGDLSLSTGGAASQDFTYASQNLSQTEFGILASAQAKLPIAPMINLLGDLRYLMSLSNSDTSGGTTTIHYHDLQFLLGVDFSL